MVAAQHPTSAAAGQSLGPGTAAVKFGGTRTVPLAGGSAGRKGPGVRIGAAIMRAVASPVSRPPHRRDRHCRRCGGRCDGVTRAPLTAVIIVMEMTADRGTILPLMAAALVADAVCTLVCKRKLYHALSLQFQ